MPLTQQEIEELDNISASPPELSQDEISQYDNIVSGVDPQGTKRENIYVMDRKAVINAPSGVSADQIGYEDDVQNLGKDRANYVGYKPKPQPEQSTFDSVMETLATPVDITGTAIMQTGTMVQKAVTGTARLFNKNIVETEFVSDFVQISEASNEQASYGLSQNLEKYKTSTAGSIATDVATGLTQLPFYVGATVTTGGAGLFAVVSTSSFEDFYRESVAAGKTEDEAQAIGLAGGSIIGALNTVYIGKLISVADDVARPMINKVLVNTGNGAISEGAEAVTEEVLLGATDVRDNTASEAVQNIAYQAMIGGITFGAGTPAFGGSYKGEKKTPEEAVAELTDAGVKEPEKVVEGIAEAVEAASAEVVRAAEIDVQKANDDPKAVTELMDAVQELDSGDPTKAAIMFEKAGIPKSEISQVVENFQSIKQEADQIQAVNKEAKITQGRIDKLDTDIKAIDKEADALGKVIKERESQGKSNTANKNRMESLLKKREGLNSERAALNDKIKPLIKKQEASETISQLDQSRIETYKAAQKTTSLTGKVTAKLVERAKDVGGGLSAALEPVDSRLLRISPSIGNQFRKFTAREAIKTAERSNALEPLLKKMSKIKKKDAALLDIAMKNRWQDDVDIIAKKYGFEKELKDFRALMDGLRLEAKEQGIDLGYLENYYPRLIKNPKKFMAAIRKSDKWTMFDEALLKLSEKTGKVLSEAEKTEAVRRMLMGQAVMGIKLSIPASAKNRTIQEIDSEFMEFYAPTQDAMITYITDVTQAIEQRRFFGQGTKKQENMPDELENVISTYVLRELAAGNIKPNQDAEIEAIFKARFNQERVNPLVRLYKNSQYILTMGNIKSAITQIGDVYTSLYFNGVYNTALGISDLVTGKTPVSRKDLNINTVAAEFNNDSISGKAVDLVFTANFLKAVDSFGKTTFLNSSMRKIQKQAKGENKALKAKLDLIFEKESDQVMSDLASGTISENVKVLMGMELMRVQPITLSQMPLKYLQNPNGRVFYMLKTFTIKHLDIIRTEVFDQFKDNPIQAGQNLVRLAIFYTIMGATADELKNLLRNKSSDLSDVFVDNLLKFAGASKFEIDRAKRQSLGDTLKDTIFPPTRSPKDWRDVPVVGDIYYYWFGREDDKKIKAKNKYKEALGID